MVHLASLPPVPFRVELTIPGFEGLTYTRDCDTPGACTQDVFFPGVTAERAVVTVSVGTRDRATDVAPAYSNFRPNGPSCPPECRNATVNVDVPL